MAVTEPHAAPQKIAGRSVTLDAFRGVAILLVFDRHQQISPDTAGTLSTPAGLWQRFGWTGVDLFFVLSGFLIGGLLLKEILKFGNLRPGRFLIRRGLKIWPSYYVYLAWVAVEKLWIDPPSPAAHFAEVWHSLWPSRYFSRDR